MGSAVSYISSSLGIQESAVRFLGTFFGGLPLAAILRTYFVDTKRSPIQFHLFFVSTGSIMLFWNFGWDMLHHWVTVIAAFVLIKSSHWMKQQWLGSWLVGLFMMGHLLWAYYVYASEDGYDIDFTMPQCVLVLRLIGLAIDLCDNSKGNGDKMMPSLIETLGYSFSFFGLMAGPQYSIQLYLKYVNLSLFPDKVVPEGSTVAALARFFYGLIYLIAYEVLGMVVKGGVAAEYLASDQYRLDNSFPQRIMIMFLVMKRFMIKYYAVWLLAESACIMSGIAWVGDDDGASSSSSSKETKKSNSEKWNGLANIYPWVGETATCLAQMIFAFNINTNAWVKRYIFKRMAFLGNKQISSLVSLLFLAIWHGFAPGYFLCFVSEFLYVEAERRAAIRYAAFKSRFDLSSWMQTLAFFIESVVGYIWTNASMFYGGAAFAIKTLEGSLAFYRSVYYFGHISIAVIFILDALLPSVKKSVSDRDKKQK